jgi:hypothetical protein
MIDATTDPDRSHETNRTPTTPSSADDRREPLGPPVSANVGGERP